MEETEELKLDKEKFVLLSREEQLDFIERKISFILNKVERN